MDWIKIEVSKPPDDYKVLFYIKSKLKSSPIPDGKIMVYGYKNGDNYYYFGSTNWERLDLNLWEILYSMTAPKFPDEE